MKPAETRKVQIICTLGPASSRKETILKMAQAGMAVARLNFSHGSHEIHQKLIDTIRTVNADNKLKIKILQDLEGYRIRIGHLERPMNLIKYQHIWMGREESHEKGVIPLETEFDLNELRVGMEVYIDDGRIHLRVEDLTRVHDHPVLRMEVLHGGVVYSRKGVNIPKLRLKADILTAKDKRDIEFGIKNSVDFIAQSFVRNQKDIDRVTGLVRPALPGCQIIAKIENQEGLRNLGKIIESCDGIMVARGDLGVSLPIFRIPMIQKDIIRRCNRRKKMVITATQMLESMIDSVRPTRAEVSDVANAIIDGTDYVMLSGETAAGCFPVKAVRMMQKVITYTQKSLSRIRAGGRKT